MDARGWEQTLGLTVQEIEFLQDPSPEEDLLSQHHRTGGHPASADVDDKRLGEIHSSPRPSA